MKLLFLCGYYEPKHEAEVASVTKGMLETASNLHQQRLIEGLQRENGCMQVISAPFIGAWPVRSSLAVFRGFQQPSQLKISYVPFRNFWGLRSISRALALCKPLEQFLSSTRGSRRAIVVYAPHTPFLYAAVRAKQRDPELHICLIVPDLPQYMNLNEKGRWFYDICKRFDIRLFQKWNQEVDSYLLLTKAMAEALQTGERPFVTAEGISDTSVIHAPDKRSKTFVYAGKLVQRFGMERLLNAFALLDDPAYRLIICGDGEMRAAVEAAAQKDPRIEYAGHVSRFELNEIFCRAGALVNPRTGGEAYTRYSFPSKIIEYLQTGLPVVSNFLEGMPPVYRELMYCPADDSDFALACAMEKAINAEAVAETVRIQKVQEHLRSIEPAAVARRMLDMIARTLREDQC